ncbi:septation protein IspZ [Rhodobacteraceae bacterium]|nr:septation protein IspZ [Paracoccaceae bacterium]
MSDKQVSNGLKSALEFGPVALFFIAYIWLKDEVFQFDGTEYGGFIIVTAGFVPLMILSTLALWKLTGTLSKMQIFTVVLVTVFGGLSVWQNDKSFLQMKPTILYLLFAAILGFGLLRKQSYLQYMMGEMMPLQDRGWMILTQRMALLFLALAVLNEVIWRNMSEETWVYFKTFGLPMGIFSFFIFQGRLFKEYAIRDDTEE